MQTFCTIISTDYLAYAKALQASLHPHDDTHILQVFLTDAVQPFPNTEGLQIWTASELVESRAFQNLYKIYGHRQRGDEFRWALKPVFLMHLLSNGFDKVIYVDADIYFFSNPQFLFDALDKNSVLLTPHWRSIDPLVFEDLFALLKDGYFNAGFVGASRDGVPALNWWATACMAKMEKSVTLGIYDDQKYLDLLPLEFPHVHTIQHRGCNLAYWNMETNRRGIQEGRLVINQEYEPVFVHFTTATVEHILNGDDCLLLPLYNIYIAALQAQGLIAPSPIEKSVKDNGLVATVKRKLLLRTRLKRFLYRISEIL